jgi:hypothetical protein
MAGSDHLSEVEIFLRYTARRPSALGLVSWDSGGDGEVDATGLGLVIF